MSGSVALFLSYAHEDEPYRSELEKHLAALRGERLIDEWHDRRITAGSEWERAIHDRLDAANVILLLISPDFMASRYIGEVEVTRAMQRHEMSTARVIPVLVRPADWSGAPFSKLQAVPSNAVPISEWPGRDAAFADVVAHLRTVCGELAATPGNPANPYVVASVGDWFEAEVLVESKQTGETSLARARLVLIEKDAHRAIVRAEFESDELGHRASTMEIPLDRPLEDSMGSVVGTLAGEFPPNATVSSRQTGAGAEKLFIGGNTYYTTWVEIETEVRMGRERVVQTGRRWLCADVPLDGIVKTVMETPDATQTMIVTGYGRAGTVGPGTGVRSTDRQARPAGAPRPAGAGAARPSAAAPASAGTAIPEPEPALDRLIVGRWNVTISQPFGPPLAAAFEFDASGAFAAEMMSPVFGPMAMQGQWSAIGGMLAVQGVQSAGLASMPYAAQVAFDAVMRDRLEGRTATGETVSFRRTGPASFRSGEEGSP